MYASRGYRVGIAARRLERLRLLQDRYPGNIVCRAIDITAPDSTRRLHELIKELGGMDTYIHCAGTGVTSSIDDNTLETIIGINVTGFARMTGAAFRYFKGTRTRGQIAAITSIAGTKGIGSLAAYSASKRFDQTFLDALDQMAHEEHLPITITDIRPGYIRTDLIDGMFETSYPKYLMIMTLQHAVPRIFKAINRRRRVAYIDWRHGLLVKLWRLLPMRLWRHFPSGKLV